MELLPFAIVFIGLYLVIVIAILFHKDTPKENDNTKTSDVLRALSDNLKSVNSTIRKHNE